MNRRNSTTLFVIIVFIAALGFAFFIKQDKVVAIRNYEREVQVSQNDDFGSVKIDSSIKIGSDFALFNQDGVSVSSEDYRKDGKFLVVSFGFSHCPKMCPESLTAQTVALNRVFKKIGEKNANFQVFFITLDPERDDVARMKVFWDDFHPSIQMLTGSSETIDSLKESYKVFAQKLSEDENYDINHSGIIYIMDLNGDLVDVFSATDTAGRMYDKFMSIVKRG